MQLNLLISVKKSKFAGTISSVYTRVLIPVTIENTTFYMAAGTIPRAAYVETNKLF